MYTKVTHFEKALMKQCKLLNLSKRDTDLFLIAQANTITYQQLSYTGIHGTSGVGDRLSLKKLEKEDLIIGKSLDNRQRVYYLTSKGQERIRKIFGDAILNKMMIDFERKPPAGNLQLFHRVKANDFYYYFLSLPCNSLPIWNVEVMYMSSCKTDLLPRSDAYMEYGKKKYYIEQDNGTQSESVLQTKLAQYLNSDLFKNNATNSVLIFTLHSKVKKKENMIKSSYSIYRILIKMYKIWSAIEVEQNAIYNYREIMNHMKNMQYVYTTLLSNSEIRILSNLMEQYPDIKREELRKLKEMYLYDTTREEEYVKQLDTKYLKRIKKLYHISENYPELTSKLLNGMQLFLMPNHKMIEQFSFLMPELLHLDLLLKQSLFYSGIDNIEWEYRNKKNIEVCKGMHLPLTHIFENKFGNHILFFDISNNVGDRLRLIYLLKKQYFSKLNFHVCMINCYTEAISFMEENNVFDCRIPLAFINKSDLLNINLSDNKLFQVNKTDDNKLSLFYIYLDYDNFTNQLQITKGGNPLSNA